MKELKSTVLYRLPNSNQIVALQGEFVRLNYNEINLNNLNGFIINSFDNNDCLVLLNPQKKVWPQHEDFPFETVVFQKGASEPAINQPDYIARIKELKEKMTLTGVSKTVFSRVIHITQAVNPKVTFQTMCLNYPETFCYLISDAQTGTWMGASPEKLLNQIPTGEIQIHALAGTQQKDHINWTEKEYEEQQLVTDYIANKLTDHGFSDFTIGNRETIVTGKVAHLRTMFHLKDSEHLDKLVRLLHPTPAVCGTPSDQAKSLIVASEQHKRKFYTGFLGSLGTELGVHLFVNLRCMQITTGGTYIYVGGGITQKSEPEAEWNETELKAETLLQVITFQQKNN